MSSWEAQLRDEYFWGIVKDNSFYEDVLVPALSRVQLIRESIGALSLLNSEVAEQECKAALEQHMAFAFGLPPELSDLVFERCEQDLRQGSA